MHNERDAIKYKCNVAFQEKEEQDDDDRALFLGSSTLISLFFSYENMKSFIEIMI
jgi:hypothetical protein